MHINVVFQGSSSQWSSYCIVQPPVSTTECSTQPIVFITSRQSRLLSIYCVTVKSVLYHSASISCLKCLLSTGVCLTCKPSCSFFSSVSYVYVSRPAFCVVLLLLTHIRCILLIQVGKVLRARKVAPSIKNLTQ